MTKKIPATTRYTEQRKAIRSVIPEGRPENLVSMKKIALIAKEQKVMMMGKPTYTKYIQTQTVRAYMHINDLQRSSYN